MVKSKYLTLGMGTVFAVLVLVAVDVYSCTRIFWNTNPDLLIVGRTEDYATASHPTFVATPRGVKRWGTSDETKRSQAINWAVKYGNVAIYENNRFPNDGMNEAGLTARTLYYLEGSPDEIVAPDSKKKELDEDHWVSFVLDNFATVAEAVDAIRNKVYIVSVVGKKGSGYSYATPKHVAMAEATGDSAIVEIQDGKVVIFHGREFTILTNKHYRFRSLIAPSDVYFEFDGYDFTEGQPVRLVKKIDRYAQKGWSGDVIPHLVTIEGDIYEQSIE
jgi:choloylglycine hydrolase